MKIITDIVDLIFAFLIMFFLTQSSKEKIMLALSFDKK
jgi:hypothetical protein